MVFVYGLCNGKAFAAVWNIDDVCEHASQIGTCLFTFTSSYVYMTPFRMSVKMPSVWYNLLWRKKIYFERKNAVCLLVHAVCPPCHSANESGKHCTRISSVSTMSNKYSIWKQWLSVICWNSVVG